MVTWRKPLLVALVLSCVVPVAACGSSNSSSSSSSSASSGSGSNSGGAAATSTASGSGNAGADAAVQKLVPAAVKSKGTLTVASDATYAPNEFIGSDGHTVVGMDADLVNALAKVMGLKAKIQNATFDTIIPGLAAGKYDMGASSFSDNKEREKTVDFVDYFIAGESFITKASGGTSISSIADICGKTVAVEKGTTEETDAGTQSKKCQSGGKPPVKILSFSDQNQANLALSSGRAQLGFLDSPIAEYQVKQTGGQFKVVGSAYATGPYGLAVPKGSLAPAVLAALKVIMQNGTYDSILKHWGLSSGAIPAAQVKINGATS